MFDPPRLARGDGYPHGELNRVRCHRIGEHERLRLGDAHWSRRVRRVVEALRPVVMWDRLYLGGGNGRRVVPSVLRRLGDDVVVVPNSAGIIGGVRAWQLPGDAAAEPPPPREGRG